MNLWLYVHPAGQSVSSFKCALRLVIRSDFRCPDLTNISAWAAMVTTEAAVLVTRPSDAKVGLIISHSGPNSHWSSCGAGSLFQNPCIITKKKKKKASHVFVLVCLYAVQTS